MGGQPPPCPPLATPLVLIQIGNWILRGEFVSWPRNCAAANSSVFAQLRAMRVWLRVEGNVQNCLAKRILHGWKIHFRRIARLQPQLTADVRGGEIPRSRHKFQSGFDDLLSIERYACTLKIYTFPYCRSTASFYNSDSDYFSPWCERR